ncbi:LpqB family beta-propeller domain-containing protein [Cryobacterium sp. SO2]|uniref:LpqB family beta-propeller domain-containing protein n=1 Tax=Cryobacterium sp. SO2 TaxID=1897060 RepID=UPI00223DB579|nr:LpqB family beta-propeller domain-containing protein [Cryobacterium sp. SO2]WEO78178.1 LpqB family beta-propeller domain-containing protein [Cryobacterium sp. SO2]
MSSRHRLLAVVTAAALLLSGCSSIPRSGAVQAGQDAVTGENPAPIFLPFGPGADATMEEILTGFIDAATSPDNNYEIAREFLTPEFSESWKSDAGVTVYDGSERTFGQVDESTMMFEVKPVAEVNANGEYHEEASSSSVPLRYSFTLVDGQWRISAAPNGTVLDQSTFKDVFSAQSLYFFDPDYRYLIPDVRWYPRGASTPTKIVNGVLNGPSEWLAGAVTSAFPEGTALTADAVTVVARDAKVDLNSEALNADTITLQRMRSQLETSLPSGLTVSITINQNSQDIDELGSSEPEVNPRVDARALVLRDGEFGFLAATGKTVTPLAGLSESIVALAPTAIALSPSQTAAAALTPSGVFGVRVGDEARLLDPRQNLIEPSIDGSGFVWSVPADRPNELFVYNAQGEASALLTPWLDASSIAALQVSRDGTRVIALLSAAGETRLVVAAVLRENGVPTGLGEAVQLASGPGTPVDATWIDQSTVAYLSVQPNGEDRIVAHEIGGTSTQLESSTGITAIAGSNLLRDLRALSTDGSLLVQRGVGWQERIGEVTVIATQQGIGG